MGGDYLLLELYLSPPTLCLFSVSFYLSNSHSLINKICGTDFGMCSVCTLIQAGASLTNQILTPAGGKCSILYEQR